MLTKFFLENFKSYQRAELPIRPLTVLIGANASGKSNVLEGLQFLSWLAQGEKLSNLQNRVNDDDRVVRGNVGDLVLRGEEGFSVSCQLDDRRYDTITIDLMTRENDLQVVYESVYAKNNSDQFLYKWNLKEDDTAKIVQKSVGGDNMHGYLVGLSDSAFFPNASLVVSLFSDMRATPRENLAQVLNPIINVLKNIHFLDPIPGRMRNYSFKTERILRSDGRNISGVLFHLIKQDSTRKKLILDFISSLPEQNIVDLEFIETERGECMVRLVETYGETTLKFDAGLLSDGTLRVLSYIAALLSVPEGSMLVIEEIDNGVHPSRVDALVASIRSIAAERSLSILLTSHNPTLLDALPLEAVPDVVFCYRDPKTGYSQLKPLHELPDYPELIAQGSLGDLLVRGMVDRYAKRNGSEAERKQAALSFLEQLK